jgi:hypothetical protein
MSDKIKLSSLFWLGVESVGIIRLYNEEAAPAHVLLDVALDFIDDRICDHLC